MNFLKTAAPIVISAIALIISIVTYLNSIKAANVTLSVGEWMEVVHDKESLRIHLPIVFQNTGAQVGVVRSLGLIFRDPETKEGILVKWDGFLIPGGTSSWKTESSVTPVSVPGRSDVTKMASFYGAGDIAAWLPKPTTYEVYLLAWTSDTRVPSETCLVKWTFTQKDVSDVKSNYDTVRTGGVDSGTWVFRSGYAPDSTKLSASQFSELVGQSK